MFAISAVFLAVFLGVAQAAPPNAVKAELTVNTNAGYARLVFRFDDYVDSQVKLSNGILVVSFQRPVDVSVDRLDTNAPGYVSAARRDPDGTAVRIALSRKVTVNSMAAGERLFVDLLPDSWSGPLPGLPQEVVEELARRARDAEKKAREQRQLAEERQLVPTRVRVAKQPTFTRYVFELSELIPVSTDRKKDRLTLLFDSTLKFDLADAIATKPPFIDAIDSASLDQTTGVTFTFNGKVDIRTFREDNNYVVDIGALDAGEKRLDAIMSGKPAGGDGAATPTTEDASAKAATNAKQPSNTEPDLQQPQSVGQAQSRQAQSSQAQSNQAQIGQAEGQPATVPRQVTPTSPKQPAAAPAPAEVPAPTRTDANQPTPQPQPQSQTQSLSAPSAAGQSQQVDAGQTKAPSNETPSVASGGREIVKVELRRLSDNVRLTFPFTNPTAAAVFRRADTLWIVFDTEAKLDVAALNSDPTHTISGTAVGRSNQAQIVRIKLERPRLTSLAADGTNWTVTVGDTVLEPTSPLNINRNAVGGPRASVTIPFEGGHVLHRLSDPDIGDTLLVITAFGPARGFLKTQDFVEFRALASTHGIVIQPLADDLNADLAPDKVIIGRPGGLTLSSTGQGAFHSTFQPVIFDPQLWGFDREAAFRDRQMKLLTAAAAAPETKRSAPRLDLARFYMARDLYVEAKGVLDVALADERPTADDTTGVVMQAVANIMMGRPNDGLKDLQNPLVGDQNDAQLWRAVAYAEEGKWAEARDGFRDSELVLGTLPIELQRMVLKEAVRASIETGDFAGAASKLNDFDSIGVSDDMKPAIDVLTGRVAEGLGRYDDALGAYRAAAESADRPAAAQGKLREVVLRYKMGDLKPADAISELETITTVWRGDETEIEALQLLARLYTQENRYRDAFYAMRSAMQSNPNSEMTHRIQDEAATTFDSLFLAGKSDAMPTIDALSLFYDFRELTPIGRRGDEMIRRLADRLVTVDLLDQAAELLQHQVDHRLQGAARAQVATRLAVIYLMDRKPDRALATLRATRTADLSNELRDQRLLLEARALSDIGRRDLALEIITDIDGRIAIRLRSDILWSAARWRESAEQIELLYGDRWRDWQPLNDAERADILRAATGYALAQDRLGMQRFREKYGAKMLEGPDRHAFEIVSAPLGPNSAEFREIAKSIAAVDTLDSFLREMRARYPETGAFSAVSQQVAPPAAKAATQPTPGSQTQVQPPNGPSSDSGRLAKR